MICIYINTYQYISIYTYICLYILYKYYILYIFIYICIYVYKKESYFKSNRGNAKISKNKLGELVFGMSVVISKEEIKQKTC